MNDYENYALLAIRPSGWEKHSKAKISLKSRIAIVGKCVTTHRNQKNKYFNLFFFLNFFV